MRYKVCTPQDIKVLQSRIARHKDKMPKLTDKQFKNVSIITSWNLYHDKINKLCSKHFAEETCQKLPVFYSNDKWKSEKSDDSKQPRRRKLIVNPPRMNNTINLQIQKTL